MGLRRRLAKMLEPQPGPQTTGRDPYNLLTYLLRGTARPVILDVGCNEGQSAARLLQLLPGAIIHAFEPSPSTADRCRARFAGDARVTIHGQALGAEPGQLTLNTHAGGATDSLLADGDAFRSLTPEAWAAAGAPVEVEVETLDNAANRMGLSRIDLLKTDTQGFDDRVLAGARGLMSRGAIGIVYAEMIFAPLYEGQAAPHAIMQTLAEAGFRMAGMFDIKCETGPVIAWCDAMFVHESRLK